MKKTPKYSQEDVLGWESAYLESARRIVRKVRAGDIENGHSLSSLACRHEYLGLTHIERGNYSKCLGHFGAAAAVWANLLERYVAGETIDRDLVRRGPPFDLAHAADDESTIRRLAAAAEKAYADERSRDAKLYYSIMIDRSLSLGDLETASQLTASFPEAKSWTMAPIIDHDEKGFAAQMRRFADIWKDRVRSERLQRLPDAVCDHYEIGWIKLAEKVWGKRPEIDLEPGKIPKEIFEVKAELIDPGI